MAAIIVAAKVRDLDDLAHALAGWLGERMDGAREGRPHLAGLRGQEPMDEAVLARMMKVDRGGGSTASRSGSTDVSVRIFREQGL